MTHHTRLYDRLYAGVGRGFSVFASSRAHDSACTAFPFDFPNCAKMAYYMTCCMCSLRDDRDVQLHENSVCDGYSTVPSHMTVIS